MLLKKAHNLMKKTSEGDDFECNRECEETIDSFDDVDWEACEGCMWEACVEECEHCDWENDEEGCWN